MSFVARFVIVAACFGGHCVTIGVCHCLTKSDMFGCQCVRSNLLTGDELFCAMDIT